MKTPNLMNRKFVAVLCLFCSLVSWAETMPTGYYDRIEGTQDSVLKATLKTIIRNHTVYEYGSGKGATWEIFYYADQDENGYCMDMYCDSWKKFTSVGSVVSGCNIEHSFAKSWWGGTENDAYKDCYHLNPSNSTANSSRSNFPLGVPTMDIKDKSVTGSLTVGKATYEGETFWVFEPKDEYKGDFARAYFYMATCYGHDLNGNPDVVCSKYKGWRLDNAQVGSKFAMRNDSYLEFRDWEIQVLLQWHRMDPVSQKELDRMDAVSDFQHNRNPFIEYPCLAEYIWGNRKGQKVTLSAIKNTYDENYLQLPDSLRNGCQCNNTETNIENTTDNTATPVARKVLRNGQILIIRDNVYYTIYGTSVSAGGLLNL